MLKNSLGKNAKRKTALKNRVSIEIIFMPLSYRTKPIKSITRARKSDGGESKKSKYDKSTMKITIKESTL